MSLELMVKAMGELFDTLTLDDCHACAKVFANYVQRIVKDAVKEMPYGASYEFTKYDSSTQTIMGEYQDKNMTLEVRVPITCKHIDVSQIIEAHQTEGYVFTIETIQRTQRELKEVIMNAIAPVALVMAELKENTKD